MQLHLVGGFLGSGKTTAIMAAARALIASGKKVGVVTNDQGKYLVDTGFFKWSGMPAVEVTGGCFCCNYDDLNQRLDELVNLARPDVIFAESVGSCADLVATVIRPMLNLRANGPAPSSFSVFVDSRLLRLHLMGQLLPFSEDVVYIFEKQLEEAGLVVINKVDLLSETKRLEVETLFRSAYPHKVYLLQNSLAPAGTHAWLHAMAGGSANPPQDTLEMDYQRYGAGEAQLAWLDQEWLLDAADGDARKILVSILSRIVSALKQDRVPVGHLKFLVEAAGYQGKLSLTTLEQPAWLDQLPQIQGPKIRLLINGRVQMDAGLFKQMVDEILNSTGAQAGSVHSNAFHPGQPHPAYRYPQHP